MTFRISDNYSENVISNSNCQTKTCFRPVTVRITTIQWGFRLPAVKTLTSNIAKAGKMLRSFSRNFMTTATRCRRLRKRPTIPNEEENEKRILEKTTQLYSRTQSIAGDDKEPRVKNLLNNATTFLDSKPEDINDRWATLPYAAGTPVQPDKDARSERENKISPQDTAIVLFPGQGSQYVGMAKNLLKYPTAIDIFEHASDILG